MKTNKNFLKKLTAGILGFVMTLGVGAAGYAASGSVTNAASGDSHTFDNANSGTSADGKWSYVTDTNGGSSSPAMSSGQLRLYPKNKITFTGSSGITLTSATFTCAINKNSKNVYPTGWTSSKGTITSFSTSLTSFTVTGVNSGEFTITINGSAGNVGLKTVTMNYSGGTTTTYSVSFNNGGGSGTMSQLTGQTSIQSAPNCTFTAPSGKEFSHWSTSSGGSAATFPMALTDNITLYAVWKDAGGSSSSYKFATTSDIKDGLNFYLGNSDFTKFATASTASSGITAGTAPATYVLQKVSNESTYYLKTGSTYVYNTNSTTVGLNASTKSKFKVVKLDDDPGLILENTELNNRFLGFTNASCTSIKAYATSNLSGQPHVYILVDNSGGSSDVYATDVAISSTDFTIQNKTITLEKNSYDGSAMGSLIATVTPDNATNKDITWESSNESVAVVDESDGSLLVDTTNTGSCTITAYADGAEEALSVYDEITIEVVDTSQPILTSVTVGGTPVTPQYAGQTFNYSGLTFTPVYDKTPDSPDVIDPSQLNWGTLVAGTHPSASYTSEKYGGTVTITVESVTPIADYVTSVVLSGTMGKTTYYAGEDWDLSNFSVNAYYASAPSTPVSVTTGLTWNHTPAKANEVGTYSVSTSVTYSSVSSNTINTTVSVTVEHGTTIDDPLTVAEAIDLTPTDGSQTSKEYFVRGYVYDKFSYVTSAGKFSYFIKDADVDNSLEIYNGLNIGKEPFESVDDLSIDDEVIVKGYLTYYAAKSLYEFADGSELMSRTELTVESIEIKTSQTKTLYNVGDTFDPSGLVITAYYSDHTHGDIDYDTWENGGFSFTNVNSDGEVTITFWEASCTQTVTLLVVTDITGVQSHPSTIQVGDTISPSDVVLTANLQSGGSTTVTPDSVSVDSSSAGTKTATATYNAATGIKTATFTVSVVLAPQTATVVIADVADANGWIDEKPNPTFTEAGFTFTGTASGNNTKYYDSDETWRFYNGGAGITITPETGSFAKLKSVSSNPALTWTVNSDGTSASCENFTATVKIKSFTIEYYPPVTISKINLTDGSTTVTSDDLNPSFTLTKEETEFTATYEPDDATDSLTWSLNSDATNLSFDAATHKVTVTSLLANASGVLTVSSKNVNLSAALSYTAPAKTISYISIPAGQTVDNAYIAGETFNPAGLTINITYTNSLYDDEVVPYNGNESKFSFTYKYAGASESDPEIPITTGFAVPEGSSSVDAKIKVYYEDEHGSDDVNTLTVHISKAAVPVGNLTVSKTSTNLDFFEHNSGKLTATVTPAGATDKTVTWESLTPTIATIDEDGNISVVAESTNADQTAIFRCTTNGLDADGQPIVKDTSVVIHRHVVASITVADENGNPILGFENFEAGKTYQLTANDKYFDDEDDDVVWNITQGSSAASLSSTTGKTVTLTCTKTVATLNVGATIHDSARKPIICSIVNQPVSDVIISADKTTLYSNQTALITLSVNQYSVISDDIDIDVSDESIATVTPVENTNNQFTFTALKGGEVTVKISVDGVESNELIFNVVEYLNDITYEGTGEPHTATLTITSAPSASGAILTDDLGNEYTFTTDGKIGSETTMIHVGTNSAAASYIKISSSAFSSYNIQSISMYGAAKVNTNSYQEISIGGNSIAESDAYLENTTSSGGTELIGTNSNGYSGDILLEVKRDESAFGALYFIKAVITYTDPSESGTQHIANKNIDVQDKVLQFANYFNNLESITTSNWNDIKAEYDEIMDSFETDEEKALAQKMFKYASNSGSSLDTLQKCVKKYDSAFAKLGLTDDQNFMDREKIDISCSIDVSIGFQFTGLDVTKFEFIFTGDYTAENPSSYGFMISKNIDTLNACISEGETSGSGVTTFVCDDDEAECVAGVSVQTGSKLTYNVVFYYVENGETHYSEVITICINDYLLSDEFDIDSITDPYAKIAIQFYIANLENNVNQGE